MPTTAHYSFSAQEGSLQMDTSSMTVLSEQRFDTSTTLWPALGLQPHQQGLLAHEELQHYAQESVYGEGHVPFDPALAESSPSRFAISQYEELPSQAPDAMLSSGHYAQHNALLAGPAQIGQYQMGTENQTTVDVSNAWHEQLPIASTYGDPRPAQAVDAYQWYHVPSHDNPHQDGQPLTMGLGAGYDESQYYEIPAATPMGSNVVAPQSDYGHAASASPSGLPVQDPAPSLLSHRVVQKQRNKKIRVMYGGSARRHWVKVYVAIGFLEYSGLIGRFATYPPNDRHWLHSLERWLNRVLNKHSNPDLHAVLFGRSCDQCEARKVKCERDIFTLKCRSCAEHGDQCQTLRPMKQRGRPTLEEVAAREVAQGSGNSTVTQL